MHARHTEAAQTLRPPLASSLDRDQLPPQVSLYSSSSDFTPQVLRSTTQRASASTEAQRTPALVTVFGFNDASIDKIKESFAQLGTLLSSSQSGNWITLEYADTLSARQALDRNGSLVDGCLIGVLSGKPLSASEAEEESIFIQKQSAVPSFLERLFTW